LGLSFGPWIVVACLALAGLVLFHYEEVWKSEASRKLQGVRLTENVVKSNPSPDSKGKIRMFSESSFSEISKQFPHRVAGPKFQVSTCAQGEWDRGIGGTDIKAVGNANLLDPVVALYLHVVGSGAAEITEPQINVCLMQGVAHGKLNFIHQNVGSLGQVESSFRDSSGARSGHGAVMGSVGSPSGFLQSETHLLGLRLHSAPLAITQICDERCGESRYTSAGLDPPSGRRFVFMWSSAALLFPCCYFGSKFIDSGRKDVVNTLVVGGFVFFGLGLGIFVLTDFV
jgi:hypothetical protein